MYASTSFLQRSCIGLVAWECLKVIDEDMDLNSVLNLRLLQLILSHGFALHRLMLHLRMLLLRTVLTAQLPTTGVTEMPSEPPNLWVLLEFWGAESLTRDGDGDYHSLTVGNSTNSTADPARGHSNRFTYYLFDGQDDPALS